MKPIAAALLFALALPSLAFADKVADARARQLPVITRWFKDAKVAFPPGEIYLRGFKQDGALELWAGPKGKPLTLVKTWPICASSGTLGPKRTEGDEQVPEGFYAINVFNPKSSYHLSLGLDYPNASDRVLGTKGHLGGAIFIHGKCVTIGCIPIEDEGIEQLYTVALAAKESGQARLRVDLFPTRLDEKGRARLKGLTDDAALLSFWNELAPGYERFERTRRPPEVSVDGKTGRYRVK